MDGFTYMDPFEGKGLEYLLVLLFLITLVPFWRGLGRRTGTAAEALREAAAAARGLFHLPASHRLHRGHSWAAPGVGSTLRTGLDEFAAAFLGPVESLELPPPGTVLREGEPAWSLQVGGKTVRMPAPVSGRVRAVNQSVVLRPSLLLQDPYIKGWLLEIVPRDRTEDLGRLLYGERADSWLARSVDQLRLHMGGELGMVMQDGGTPLPGFGVALFPEEWPAMAAEMFPVEVGASKPGGTDASRP